MAPTGTCPTPLPCAKCCPPPERPRLPGRHNYALYDERGELLDPAHINWAHVTARQFPYTIRQATCCDNALGNIVFRFNNPYSVYLHDTPQRQLFAQPMRALSHGCIRLEHPWRWPPTCCAARASP
nr:L,D-transpeptidase family protein [Hymenobacter sp. BRD128]